MQNNYKTEIEWWKINEIYVQLYIFKLNIIWK